jgi:hypothetical protein
LVFDFRLTSAFSALSAVNRFLCRIFPFLAAVPFFAEPVPFPASQIFELLFPALDLDPPAVGLLRNARFILRAHHLHFLPTEQRLLFQVLGQIDHPFPNLNYMGRRFAQMNAEKEKIQKPSVSIQKKPFFDRIVAPEFCILTSPFLMIS